MFLIFYSKLEKIKGRLNLKTKTKENDEITLSLTETVLLTSPPQKLNLYIFTIGHIGIEMVTSRIGGQSVGMSCSHHLLIRQVAGEALA